MTQPQSIPGPGLNPQQQAVVDRLAGDTFVAAGAGSGKTRVLAERFAAVILGEPDEAARPGLLRRVLLITFTDKAAGELGERVRRVLLERGHPELARAVDEAWISTIHGFCARIVRRHALELGIDPGFAVLVDPQTGVVRQQAFEEAAIALADADTDVAEVLETHGVAEVRHAVALGLDQVRAMGRSPGCLSVPAPPDCAAVLRLALQDLPGTVAEYKNLRPLGFVEHNRGVLTELLGHLRILASLPEPDLPTEIVTLHAAFPLKSPGNAKGQERELTLEAIGTLAALVRAGVDAVASRHAHAFVRLVAAYGAAYQARKEALAALDFEDLQSLAARVFEERPDIAARYADRFLATMVDEFQDTNDLQLRVVGPIAAGKLCVVGDEKQSIYGFRFADVDVFRSRAEALEAADPDGSCALQTNYRSHADLLATFNAMFDAEPFFPGRYLHLEAGRAGEWRLDLPPGAPRTEVLLVDRAGWETLHWRDAEARALAGRIAELVAGGTRPGDIVVLLRQMTTARPYVRALRSHGLEVYAQSSGGFFAAPEVADVRALLATLANPRDGDAVIGLLAGGLGGVSDDGLYRLTREAAPPDGVWAALGSVGELAPADEQRCRLVRETVEHLRAEQGRMRLADMLLDAAAALGPGGGCLARDGAWANLRKAARIAAEFERVAQADPAAFLRHLEEREAFVKREAVAGILAEDAGAIRLMTVHAAKGLEFPVVAVGDLGHESRPDRDTLVVVKDGEAAIAAARLPKEYGDGLPTPTAFGEAAQIARVRALEEDKRVFYVACTRAEELLILSGGASLAKGPGERLAIDWVREAIGDPESPTLPGVRVTTVTARDEPDLLGAPTSVWVPDERSAVGAVVSQGPEAGSARPEVLAPPTDLSYTALALYERCPYRFFAERVLGVGSLEETDADGGPRGLGLAVHAGLQLLAEGQAPDETRLEALARYHRLDADGRVRLGDTVAAFRAGGTAAAIAGRDARAEVHFGVGIGHGTLVGKLDLLVRDGEGALVVDYKTGAAELDAAEARARFERQAAVYALALLRAGAPRVQVRFVEVERDGRETRFDFGPEQAQALESRIARVFASIAAGEYPRLPSFDHGTCRDCPVSGSLCPVVPPGTKRRKAVAGD